MHWWFCYMFIGGFLAMQRVLLLFRSEIYWGLTLLSFFLVLLLRWLIWFVNFLGFAFVFVRLAFWADSIKEQIWLLILGFKIDLLIVFLVLREFGVFFNNLIELSLLLELSFTQLLLLFMHQLVDRIELFLWGIMSRLFGWMFLRLLFFSNIF